MTQLKNAPKKMVPISAVVGWEKNPRNITKTGMKRLENQMKELGIYKTLLCTRSLPGEKGKYITLGGNMRLIILRDLKQEEVEIALVKADSDALRIKYALSDNDLAGETEDQMLAELVFPYIEEIHLEDYNIDRGESQKLSKMMEDYAPGSEKEQARLEKIAKKEQVKCPECGLEFIP